MAEYISKDVVIAFLNNEVPLKQFMNRNISKADEAMNDLCVAIICLPAGDVRPVEHGKWKVDRAFGADVMSGEQMVICSNCGKGSYSGKTDFCPNCGADMREEQA